MAFRPFLVRWSIAAALEVVEGGYQPIPWITNDRKLEVSTILPLCEQHAVLTMRGVTDVLFIEQGLGH